MATDTIAHRIQEQGSRRPDGAAFYEKSGGQWKMTTWKTYASQIRQAGKSLVALGVDHGTPVTILGFNSPEWTTMDCAAFSVGGVPAGIYAPNPPEEIEYILNHCESPVLLIEDETQWAKIAVIKDQCPHLKHVVTYRGVNVDDPMVMTWDEFMAAGSKLDDSVFDQRMSELEDDQLATLIYTSGTTANPKGVMLSHKNLWWTADAALKITNVDENDCTLSYLPLAHIAEQMFTIHVPVSAGYPVYFAEGMTPEILAGNLGEVQPTVFFGVPRIWEKFHAKLDAGLGAATGIKAVLAGWAMGVGREVSQLKMKGEAPSGLLGIKYNLANKLIFSKVKPKIGLSRAKICVSGAAPIAPEVLEFFTGLDIVVQEVYGQSEDTGPTSFNLTGRTRFGSVGPAVEGCEVVIADDDEILVRGPNVFMGYYKDADATANTLIDGWLHSGDLGSFDDDGFLSITGRKKDIIITAGGKNIAPKKVEAALKNIQPINEAVMVGDKRKFCSAVVTIDPDWAADYAKKQGTDVDKLHEYAPLREMLEAEINTANQEFPSVMQIKKFAILPRNFTIEDKELTPTLKVKRRFVYENWDAEIEALYS